MVKHYLPSFFLLICAHLTMISSVNSACIWQTVGDAQSLISKTCLRLSMYKCDCSGAGGCSGRYYKVEELGHGITCAALITWCDWSPWTHTVQTSNTNTGCAKVSSRKRICCVKDDGRSTPINTLNSEYWDCPRTPLGALQTTSSMIACPSPRSNISIVLIAVIVCLFVVTVMAIVVRIFFYKRISGLFHRSNVSRVVSTNQLQNQTPVVSPAHAALYSQYATPLPNYDEAMRQMSKPPSYDEAVRSPDVIENMPPPFQSLPTNGTTNDAERRREDEVRPAGTILRESAC